VRDLGPLDARDALLGGDQLEHLGSLLHVAATDVEHELERELRPAAVAQDDAAKAKADDIRHRLLAGEPFARIAGEVSDATSKANGGLIGPIKVDELAPALQTMLTKLKVGDVSEVIRMQRGYQIFGLESRTETKVKSFDEARQDISDRIADEKRRGETQKYLEKLRAAATITWHNDELKKAYEQALAERQKQLESQQGSTPAKS